jgi:integrase/recombinase XerD
MTLGEFLSQDYGLLGVYSNFTGNVTHLEGYPADLNLETYLHAISQSQADASEHDEVDRKAVLRHERRRGLDRVLRKLSEVEIAGKEEVQEYLRDQYRRHCKPSTLRNSMRAIESFLVFVKALGKHRLEEIMRGDLGAYIEHEQDRGIKASTVNMRLRTLKAFIRFLIEKNVLRADVLANRMSVKVPDSLPRAMAPEDVRKLLTVIDQSRDRAMIMVLLRTGMRSGELLNTFVSDVNIKERKIEIYEAEKTRVGRVVYLSEDALVALSSWLKKRDSDKPYLFYAQGRSTMTYPALRAMFQKYLEKAGLSLKGYSLHCLRHTFATELLNAGISLDCLQQLLGHSSIEMTLRYARLTDKTREKEYFKAMARIERGETDGYCQCDSELSATPQETQLLCSHSEKLPEHP